MTAASVLGALAGVGSATDGGHSRFGDGLMADPNCGGTDMGFGAQGEVLAPAAGTRDRPVLRQPRLWRTPGVRSGRVRFDTRIKIVYFEGLGVTRHFRQSADPIVT